MLKTFSNPIHEDETVNETVATPERSNIEETDDDDSDVEICESDKNVPMPKPMENMANGLLKQDNDEISGMLPFKTTVSDY